MDCPSCKHPNAYVGFSTIECENFQCKHAVPGTRKAQLNELVKAFSRSFYMPPTPNPTSPSTVPPAPNPSFSTAKTPSPPDYIILGHELYMQIAGPNTGNLRCDLCQRYYNGLALVTISCHYPNLTASNPVPPSTVSYSSLPIKASIWPSSQPGPGAIFSVNGTVKYIDSDGNITSITGGSGVNATNDPGNVP